MDKKIKQFDYVFIFCLLAYTVLHVFSWADNPPDVDPINFTMALEYYDVSTDRPHPPGYPLYVGLAKCADNLVGALHAYQLVNLLMLILASLSIYYTCKRFGYALVGFGAVFILLTHPMVLAATLVAETYFSDALFGCLMVSLIMLAKDKHHTQLIGVIILFFLLGLFRAVSCFELIPLALSCIYISTKEKRLRKTVITLIGILVSVIMSYLLTIYLAGGYIIYSQAVARVMGAAFSSSSIFAGAEFTAHFSMLTKLVFWLLFVSIPTVLVACLILKKYQLKQLITTKSLKTYFIFLSWVLPPLSVFSLFYFLKPTYLLIILVPIIVMFSLGTFYVLKNKDYLYTLAVIFIFATLQLGFFYGGSNDLPKPFYRLTYAHNKHKDFLWAELKSLLKQNNNSKTLLIWDPNYDLPIYAMRLTQWDGVVAITEAKNIDHLKSAHLRDVLVAVVDPKLMKWSQPKKLSEINKVEQMLILDAKNNTLSYTKIKIIN